MRAGITYTSMSRIRAWFCSSLDEGHTVRIVKIGMYWWIWEERDGLFGNILLEAIIRLFEWFINEQSSPCPPYLQHCLWKLVYQENQNTTLFIIIISNKWSSLITHKAIFWPNLSATSDPPSLLGILCYLKYKPMKLIISFALLLLLVLGASNDYRLKKVIQLGEQERIV